PAISCANSRWSTSIEALIRAMISAGPAANRPPHIMLAPLSGVSAHIGDPVLMTRWLLLGLTGAALLALAILVTFPRFTGKPADAPPLTGSMEAFTPTGRPVPAITMETPDG